MAERLPCRRGLGAFRESREELKLCRVSTCWKSIDTLGHSLDWYSEDESGPGSFAHRFPRVPAPSNDRPAEKKHSSPARTRLQPRFFRYDVLACSGRAILKRRRCGASQRRATRAAAAIKTASFGTVCPAGRGSGPIAQGSTSLVCCVPITWEQLTKYRQQQCMNDALLFC